MCTLIVAHRRVPGRPLVVAANRDEYLDRPAEGPAVRETRAGRVLAPLDLRAGGTWLGLNERGVFAALTNLKTDEPDPERRSRGEVVLDALAEASAAEAAGRLERLEAEAFNPFNLFVADAHQAWVVVYRDRPRLKPLDPGVHVIGNVEALGRGEAPLEAPGNGPGNEKVRRIHAEVSAALESPREHAGSDLLDRLAGICRSHGATDRQEVRTEDQVRGGPEDAQRNASKVGLEEDALEDALERDALEEVQEGRKHEASPGSEAGRAPLGDTCVHFAGTYGTRSSLLLELGDGRSGLHTGRLLHADGPPCKTVYEDVSSLLHDLGRRPAERAAESLMRTAS